MKTPFISIIIPCRNEQRFIRRTIEMLQRQNYPKNKMEIIVVDGQSTDSTPQIIQQLQKEDTRIRFFQNPEKLSSAARNIGAKEARGDIITYIDAHVYIDNNDLLAATAELLDKHKLHVLSRPQLLDTPDNTYFQRAVAFVRNSHLGHGLDSEIYSTEEKIVDPRTSGATYARVVFTEAGYFDQRFDASEDVEFNYRVSKVGYRSLSSPRLSVYYYPRDSFKGLFKQMCRYGIGRRRFYEKHKAGLISGPLAVALFDIAIFAFCMLSFIHPLFKFALAAAALIYSLAGLIDCLVISPKKTIRYAPLIVPIFFTIHFALGWGFLLESWHLFRKKSRFNSLSDQAESQ